MALSIFQHPAQRTTHHDITATRAAGNGTGPVLFRLAAALTIFLALCGTARADLYDLSVNTINFSSTVNSSGNFTVTVLLVNASSTSNPDGGEGTFDVRYILTRPDYTSVYQYDDDLWFPSGGFRTQSKTFAMTTPGQYTLTVKTYPVNGMETGWTGSYFRSVTQSRTYKANTTLTAYDDSFLPGESVQLKALLKSGSSGVSGRTISFSVPGASGTAQTNSSGYAYKVLTPSSGGTISVSFAGDSSYNSSSDTADLDKDKFETNMLCGSSQGTVGDTVSLGAQLRMIDGGGDLHNMSGVTLSASADGHSDTGTTDTYGWAAFHITFDESGSYSYTARYDGDSNHKSTSCTGDVTISDPPVNAGIVSVSFGDTSARVGLEDARPRATLQNIGSVSASFKLHLEVVDLDDSGSSPTVYSNRVDLGQISPGSSRTFTGSWTPTTGHEYVVIATALDSGGNDLVGSSSYPHAKSSSRCTFDENEAPDPASAPSPANGSTGNALTPTLAWSGSDPDGDGLTYNVHFGTLSPPPLVSQGQGGHSWTVQNELQPNTRYFWRVDSMDDSSTTMGTEWSFWTKETDNYEGMLYIDIDGAKYGVREVEKGGSYNYDTIPVKVYDESGTVITVPAQVAARLFACVKTLDTVKNDTNYMLDVNANLAVQAGFSILTAATETVAVDAVGLGWSAVTPEAVMVDALTGGSLTATGIVGAVTDITTVTITHASVMEIAYKAFSTQRLLKKTARYIIDKAENDGQVTLQQLKLALIANDCARILGDVAFVLFSIVDESASLTVDGVTEDLMQINPYLFFLGPLWSVERKGEQAGELYASMVNTFIHFLPQLVSAAQDNLFELVDGAVGPPGYFYVPGGPTTVEANTPPAPTFIFSAVEVEVGERIDVDASPSLDADGDSLSYSWSVVPPEGSSCTMQGAGSVAAYFVPDVAGTYLVTLTLSDGTDYISLSGSAYAGNGTPPVLEISSPSSQTTVDYDVSSLLVRGTASDADGDLDVVQYRIRGGAWVSFNASAQWSFTATSLVTGDNLVEVRARDDRGNLSPTGSVIITRRDQNQTGTNCEYTISPSALNVPAQGGSFSVTVDATDSSCAWDASSALSWASISPDTGSGDASLSVAVDENTWQQSRTGTMVVAGHPLTLVQQPATQNCTFSIAPDRINFPAAGGNATVAVTASSPLCSWVFNGVPFWASIMPASGSGSGQAMVSAQANTNATARGASVSVGGQDLTLHQDADGPGGRSTVLPAVLSLLLNSTNSTRTLYWESFDQDLFSKIISANRTTQCDLGVADGHIRAKVYDTSDKWYCYAQSPGFQAITGAKDFFISLRVNPISTDWGQYPAVYFVPQTYTGPDDLYDAEVAKKILSIAMVWADSIYDKMQFRYFGSAIYTNTIPAKNEWYTVEIQYHAATAQGSVRILRANGSTFFERSGLDFSAMGTLNRVLVGQYDGTVRYGDSAEIYVDDILVQQR